MKSFSTMLSLLAVCAVLFLTPGINAATVIFQDDFESYTASTSWPSADDVDPGTPPVGDPWVIIESSDPVVQVQSTSSGVNYCAGPHGGSNYLQTYSRGAQASVMIPAAAQELVEENKNMTLDMWLYKNLADGWNGLQTIGGYYNDSPGDVGGRSFLLYFRQDGSLEYWAGELIDTGLTYTPDTWMHLVLEADFDTHTFDVTLDGQTATDLAFATDIWGLKYVQLQGSVDIDDNCRAAYDDIVISVDELIIPPGDANRDGVVNAADAAILAENWLASDAIWGMGDFNEDGKVDDIDATILATNWQASSTSQSMTVPEPSSLVLMLSILSLAIFVRQPR